MNNPAKCPTGMKRFMEFPAVFGGVLDVQTNLAAV